MTTFTEHTLENRNLWADSRRAEEAGDYVTALQIHKTILTDEHASYAASLRAGWLYYKLGSYNESLNFYERACALSNDDWALYGIMNCLSAQGDTKTVAKVAESIYTSKRAC